MRVSILKSTGAVLECQTGDDGPLDTLLQNAISAGFTADQITVSVMPDADAYALIKPPIRDALDSWNFITLKLAFNHENRIRALEGKAAVTVAQFKTAVKAML